MFGATTASRIKGDRGLLARWNTLGVPVRDGLFTLALAPVVFAPVTAPLGAEFGDLAKRPLDGPGVLVTTFLWLPLMLRRRSPGVCLALVAAAFALHQLAAYPSTFASVGLYVALYGAGAHAERADGTGLVAALAAAVGSYVLFAVALHGRGSPQRVSDFCLIFLALAACWGAGRAVRSRRAGEGERRRRSVQAAIAQERARIARELHDVVTHHVTAMVVQADAARYLLADAPGRAADGLDAIGDSGRHALTDLRHLLGLLKAPGDPGSGGTAFGDKDSGVSDFVAAAADGRPGVADPADRAPAPGRLADLVDQLRAAGQPVELTRTGERPVMASGVELAVYRVVQEALTNALKHAPGHRTSVTVRYEPHGIEVEVMTEGKPAAGAVAVTGLGRGGGYGLIGLRERVGVFGGELTAGAGPDGGFTVTARIPSTSHETPSGPDTPPGRDGRRTAAGPR
ncbi:sensor histidine kinase [Streptomyces asoensis]|uniref:histidine kinase n=1 Tax=Streptomyces asoensis TaxID=249586 RepID=A0ABQ3RXE4_9ACTN|nr:histidine kinase [Streptomyces asoensis]GGQ53059.1 two-component sensor histidine kinase [Streptomyces asoensis]GHI60523.1 two-component sensor histidine kinase [Streptomyces asoensis]